MQTHSLITFIGNSHSDISHPPFLPLTPLTTDMPYSHHRYYMIPTVYVFVLSFYSISSSVYSHSLWLSSQAPFRLLRSLLWYSVSDYKHIIILIFIYYYFKIKHFLHKTYLYFPSPQPQHEEQLINKMKHTHYLKKHKRPPLGQDVALRSSATASHRNQ